MSVSHQIAQPGQLPAASDNLSAPISEKTIFSTKQIRIEFTGSGSEYFRIWIVNLLLMLVTLGLYFPWAKVRRLRYFYSNTLIDSDALNFHAHPAQMFKGFLLVAIGFAIYSAAGYFSPIAALAAFAVVAALWPTLFRSSMRFRMRNTSWRGLRFAFVGTLKESYAVWLPLFIPGACYLMLQSVAPELQDPDPNRHASKSVQIALTLLIVSTMGVFPWLLYRLKDYQHQNYCYGAETTAFAAKAKDYYWISLKGLCVLLVAFIPLVLLIFIFAFGFSGFQKNFPELVGNPNTLILIFFMTFVAGSFLLSLLKPYFVTRFQNLIWNSTHTQRVNFFSTLRLWPMFVLTLKNWFFTLLTLGLYWPFAVVAMTRLRLEALTIQFNEDPALWVANTHQASSSAIGDASNEFFDIDVGL